MPVLIRTDEIPHDRRAAVWREVVCDTLGPLDMDIDLDAPLRGEMATAALGSVDVGRVVTSTPHVVRRTKRLIRGDTPEMYRLVLPISGRVHLSQGDRSATLSSGELSVYDFAQPYELGYDRSVELAVFAFPGDLLPTSARRLTAVPITPHEGAAALASPMLRRIAFELDGYNATSGARLATVVSTLVAALLDERVGIAGDPPAEAVLLRVKAFIDRHLADLDLGPSMIAAAHHISVRSLHRLFADKEISVAGWIRRRRLEHCLRDLEDPALRTATVGVIASRWGFPDSAHFSRVFRRAHGVSPSEYRRVALASIG